MLHARGVCEVLGGCDHVHHRAFGGARGGQQAVGDGERIDASVFVRCPLLHRHGHGAGPLKAADVVHGEHPEVYQARFECGRARLLAALHGVRERAPLVGRGPGHHGAAQIGQLDDADGRGSLGVALGVDAGQDMAQVLEIGRCGPHDVESVGCREASFGGHDQQLAVA